MIQGGDPTGTGKGGNCIYGTYMNDEFHADLRLDFRRLLFYLLLLLLLLLLLFYLLLL